MTEKYIIIDEQKSDFQKVLNQWKHDYEIEIIWMNYQDNYYRALIKRIEKYK